jgi:hypothetical protein
VDFRVGGCIPPGGTISYPQLIPMGGIQITKEIPCRP